LASLKFKSILTPYRGFVYFIVGVKSIASAAMAGHGCLVVAVRAEESAVFQSLGRLLLLRTTLVAISYPKKKKVNT
jgi:hypothetical protein